MRIVLDIGLPLKNDKNIAAPDISGLTESETSISAGVVYSFSTSTILPTHASF